MQKLVDGIFAFKECVHKPMREFFEQLAGGQKPRALFITCCDSRVNPDLMTQAEPGDLFMLRNAGNLVPPHSAVAGGEAATIEYAVAHLGVPNIIICGHSNCGAMKGLMDPGGLNDLPAVGSWLHHAEATRRIAREVTPGLSAAEAWEAVTKANVLVQIDNLRTHPTVAAGLIRGDLFLHAWYYCFAAGDVEFYDPTQSAWVSVSQSLPVAYSPRGCSIDRIPSRAGTAAGVWIAEGSRPDYHRLRTDNKHVSNGKRRSGKRKSAQQS
jgi:carbonic anhydrase